MAPAVYSMCMAKPFDAAMKFLVEKNPLDWVRLFGLRDEMKNSTFYQSILDEGRVEGMIEGARQTLLRQGRRRFGEPTAATAERIQSETSLDRLNDLLDRILAVESWDELVRE
jgi:hypothetical protein